MQKCCRTKPQALYTLHIRKRHKNEYNKECAIILRRLKKERAIFRAKWLQEINRKFRSELSLTMLIISFRKIKKIVKMTLVFY